MTTDEIRNFVGQLWTIYLKDHEDPIVGMPMRMEYTTFTKEPGGEPDKNLYVYISEVSNPFDPAEAYRLRLTIVNAANVLKFEQFSTTA